MVADCSMGLLSAPVSPMVAADSFRRGIFPIGLATAPEKGKFKVAYYRPLVSLPLLTLSPESRKSAEIRETQ